MEMQGETDLPATGETNLRISLRGLSVRAQASQAGLNVEISDSIPYSSGSTGAASSIQEPTYPAAGSSGSRPEQVLPYNEQSEPGPSHDQQSSIPASRRKQDDDDEFEIIPVAAAALHATSFYWRATLPTLPASLRSDSTRLQRASNIVQRDQPVDVSPLERVQLAYDAGRHAASVLRNEAQPAPARFVLARSPTCYIILRGQLAATNYPCKVETFSEYKVGVF